MCVAWIVRIRTARGFGARAGHCRHLQTTPRRPPSRFIPRRLFYWRRTMFPHIETLDDVTPHISYDNGIVVSKRDGYTVVDYVFVNNDTFANDIARECRGLKFDAAGNLIARPFHKFFNIGEKQPPENVDWSRPHVVMDKLDGSMVHPCLVEGAMVFMTRMGATDQAALAQRHASAAALDLCADQMAKGYTPIFEFTSPHNRVVIDYAVPALTLSAARHIHTGAYLGYDRVVALGAAFGVPVADSFGTVGEITDFIAKGRALSGVEGFVIAF